MKKRIITGVLLIMVVQFYSKAQDVLKLRIDPAEAYGGVVSDYFDEVSYIPLQTTKESLFGTIGGFIISDSSFVISDFDTHCVLFFKLDGSYITKVKFKNDDYPNVSLEGSSKRILVSVYNSQTQKAVMLYYSLTGTRMPDHLSIKSDEKTTGMRSLGDDYYLSLTGCYYPAGKTPVDSLGYAISIYKKDQLYKRFLPFNEAATPCICALGYWPNITSTDIDSVVYAATPFDNSIYRVTKDTIRKIYTAVFPFDRTLSKSLIETKEPKRIDSLRNNIYKMEHIISGLSNIYFVNNLLLCKIDQRSYTWTDGTEASKQYNLIYNLKSGRLTSLERITPDEKSFFLPLISGFYMSIRGLEYHNGYFYGNVPSLQMFAAKESTKDKKPKYPAVLEHYFNTENRKSNPIIVQMKLKQL